MRDIPHPDLLSEIYALCERTGLSKTAFGRGAINDVSLVAELESGRECRSGTLRRIREFIDRHAPSEPAAPSVKQPERADRQAGAA